MGKQPQVLEVAAGVFFVAASRTNFAVVVEDGEVTLVDSGYPEDRDLVVAALRQVRREFKDVAAIVLTHAHADHAGSAEWLRSRWGVPVLCHVEEAPLARGEVEQGISPRDILLNLWRPGVLPFAWNSVTKGSFDVEPVEQVTTFDDRATLDVPGRPTTVFTPGHTSGHVGFHLPERGVLFTGDALVTVDVWDLSRRGPQVIRPPFNHDHQETLASVARFASLEAAAVVPGHGRPYRGTPAQAVEEAYRHEA